MQEAQVESDQPPPTQTGVRKRDGKEAIWLPPVQLGTLVVRPPTSASERAKSTSSEVRSPFFPAGPAAGVASGRTRAERIQILARGPAEYAKGFLGCRDGALTERSRRGRSIGGSPRCPGALGWLYREPVNDARRLENWMQTCPAPECDLRQELRKPVLYSPRKVLAERSEQLAACMAEVSRYQPENSTVLEAARRRQLRLKELERLEATKAVNQESQAPDTMEQVDKESPTPMVLPEFVNERGLAQLETGVDAMMQSIRSSRGSADAMRLPELAAKCRENPFSGSASVTNIAEFILNSASTEEQRAWMAFCWICYHISFEADQFVSMTAELVLKNRSTGAWGFAKLFAAICTEAHLTAKVVVGHLRRFSGLPGDDIRADDRNRHWWNAVFLRKSEWILIDCASGAAKQQDLSPYQSRVFQPFFFGVDPELLAFSHFPLDAHWQCLPETLSYDTFVSQACICPVAFSENNLRFFPERRPLGILELTHTNAGCVELQALPEQSFQASLDGDPSRCFIVPNECKKMRLKMTIVGARRLRNADCEGRFDFSDTYCVCEVPGKRYLTIKTQVVRNSLNPIWEHSFEMDDLEPFDQLVFRVFDSDMKSDDKLGSLTMGTSQFFAGSSFNGEVDLDNDGGMDSKLILRITPSFMHKANAEDTARAAIYFCTPGKQGNHCLEVSTCYGAPHHFRRTCIFNVIAPAQPIEYIETGFPIVYPEVFGSSGLTFAEILPIGELLLKEQNEVEIRLCKASLCPDIEVAADVDGDRTRAMARFFDDKVAIRAQAAPGDHILNVLVRRDPDAQFARAISYRLSVHDDCEDVMTGGYPETFAAFQELQATIEAPLTNCLQSGLCKFRLRLPRDSGAQHVAVGVKDRKDPEMIAKHDDGLFVGEVRVREPEAVLFCGHTEDCMRPLLRWKVLPANPRRSSSNRSSNIKM